MKEKFDIPRAKPGDPIRAADWHKIVDSFPKVGGYRIAQRQWFQCYNPLAAQAKPYSAFTYSAGEEWDQLPFVTLAYGSDPLVLTNAQYPILASGVGFAHVVDQWAPCKFYTDDAISATDECGPGDADFKVHSDKTGLIALTDAVGGEVWCVGKGGTGDGTTESKKLLCRFTLDAVLDTATASQDATITHQFGPGTAHEASSGSGPVWITVRNLLTSSAGVYLFEGEAGAAGYAFWDAEDDWQIIQMECPPGTGS